MSEQKNSTGFDFSDTVENTIDGASHVAADVAHSGITMTFSYLGRVLGTLVGGVFDKLAGYVAMIPGFGKTADAIEEFGDDVAEAVEDGTEHTGGLLANFTHDGLEYHGDKLAELLEIGLSIMLKLQLKIF